MHDHTAICAAAVASQEITLGNFSGWLRKNSRVLGGFEPLSPRPGAAAKHEEE
jgi:hypothetical protein